MVIKLNILLIDSQKNLKIENLFQLFIKSISYIYLPYCYQKVFVLFQFICLIFIL